MNVKISFCMNIFCRKFLKTYFIVHKNFLKESNRFISESKIDECKKNVLRVYLKDQDEFLQRRKEHEQKIKECYNNVLQKQDTLSLEDFSINLQEVEGEGILNKEVERIKEDISHKIENEEYRKKEIKSLKEHTEFIRILVTCGIRINPVLLYYFLRETIEFLKKEIEENKENILTYEKVKTSTTDYVRINRYYYKPQIHASFFSLCESLSNLLYSVSENRVDHNPMYMNIKKDVYESYLNIEDIIRRMPAFVNISLLLFHVNIWLFLEKSRKVKTLCLDHLNQYISSISEDEMNISKNDLFYLFVALRLLFHSFTYHDVLNHLNSYNKHFVGSIVLCVSHSEFMTEDIKKYMQPFIEYLNKHDKYIEPKEIPIVPFRFPLSSLKNKTVYIIEQSDDYYTNDSTILRAYNYWKYFIAQKEKYQLLYLCTKEEYEDLFNEEKKDAILMNYINKDYEYNFEENVSIPT